MTDTPRLRAAINKYEQMICIGDDEVALECMRLVLAAQGADGEVSAAWKALLIDIGGMTEDNWRKADSIVQVTQSDLAHALTASALFRAREGSEALELVDNLISNCVDGEVRVGRYSLSKLRNAMLAAAPTPQPRIRSDEDHAAALARINTLMDAEANTPEGEELDVLTDLVRHYESKSEAGVTITNAMALSRPAPTREEIAAIICSEYEDLDWDDIAPQAKREGVIEPGIHAKCVRAASRILSLMQRGGAR